MKFDKNVEAESRCIGLTLADVKHPFSVCVSSFVSASTRVLVYIQCVTLSMEGPNVSVLCLIISMVGSAVGSHKTLLLFKVSRADSSFNLQLPFLLWAPAVSLSCGGGGWGLSQAGCAALI